MKTTSLVVALAAATLMLGGIGLIVFAEAGSSQGDADERARPVGPVAPAVVAATRASKPFPKLTETEVRVGRSPLDVVIADNHAERHQGLRRRHHLGKYDGMLFVFDSTTDTPFTMSTVPVPLDITFYDSLGRVVDRLRMEPCDGSDLTCPTYRASSPFFYALETLAGKMPRGPLDTP